MLDPDVDDLDAVILGELLQPDLDIIHQLPTLRAEQCPEIDLAEFGAQRRREQRRQLVGDSALGAVAQADRADQP